MSQQKRSFKVLGIIPKHNNPRESHWLRIGTAYVNRDESINIYLDALPKSFELQLREFEEDDFRKRPQDATTSVPMPRATPAIGASPTEGPPF